MWSLPPPLSSSFYLLPALFADACTLAGGAYFLQSGFEQRSCSTHEQATRLAPFQKSQGVSSVHPQPRQARSLLIRSSWAARIAACALQRLVVTVRTRLDSLRQRGLVCRQ